MRRSKLVFVAPLAVVLATTLAPASAVGPGGWDHVGHGATSTTPALNGKVSALNTERPGSLYVGGTFTDAGGNQNADLIARWNGTAWSAVGSTPLSTAVGAEVRAVAYDAATGKVYAGGTFQNAGGNAEADFLAGWDGVSWQPVCTSPTRPAFGGNVNALQIIGTTLYVGGDFQDGAEIATADYLLACDLATGASRSLFTTDGQFSGPVYALTAIGSTLFAAGNFHNLAKLAAADFVAAYTEGAGWQAMGSGAGPGGGAVTAAVRGLTATDTSVYVGTDALDVAGLALADHVARWDTTGLAWSALGANSAGTNGWFPTTASVYALEASGSLLIAGGSFQDANGTPTADMIAAFDGTSWRPIGSNGTGDGPLPGEVHGLEVFGDKVYAGGNFTSAGGDPQAKNLATYALRQPDAGISTTAKTGPFFGLGVYSATGAGQTRTVEVRRGHTITSYLKIQNDGLLAGSFIVKGIGGGTGFKAHYSRSGTDITAAVLNGTYTTAIIDPRGSVVIRLEVKVAHSSAAKASFITKFKSAAGTLPDAVGLAVNAKG